MDKRKISAKIIADSTNAHGNRITTFICTFPRIILAEVNTHRMFSRNSASSRAIPFKKMLQLVKDDPFTPIAWMKDHKGMQGKEYFDMNEKFSLQDLKDMLLNNLMKIYETDDADSPTLIECFESVMEDFPLYSSYTLTEFWLIIRDNIITAALLLAMLGVSKQIVNRLLEPFMWHTAIITATDFENFFALRAHDAAEIHLQALAYQMLDAYNLSQPVRLKGGEWHIPFGDNMDTDRIIALIHSSENRDCVALSEEVERVSLKIATARCARVSYMNFEGKDDYAADVKLHDQLLASGHFSPFEHCAYATGPVREGNFRGFVQYRKMLQGENKSDNRVIK